MNKRRNDDEARTVRVLLGWPRTEPPFETPLVEKCERALETPLGELTTGQLRLLINQGFGLELLIPRALAILHANPLIGAAFYDGDLLEACQRAPAVFWLSNPGLRREMDEIVSQAIASAAVLGAK